MPPSSKGLGAPMVGLNQGVPAMNIKQWVAAILEQNRHLNFVDRVIRPDLYPVIDNNDGSYSTHLMAWDHINGQPSVYPTIVFNPETRGLKKLSDEDAYNYAVKSGEYIPFSSPELADKFSQNYKQYWEK